MGTSKSVKVGALALGLAMISTPLMAATIDFNGEACFFVGSTCEVNIVDGMSVIGSVRIERSDGGDIDTTDGAFGVGLGFNAAEPASFPGSLTFSFSRNVRLTGGELSAIFAEGEQSTEVLVSGPGVSTAPLITADVGESEIGSQGVATQQGFVPISFETDFLFQGNGDFTADYLFDFTDFASAQMADEDAYIQILNFEVETVQFAVPLPPSAWMLLSAIGLLGWRKYRSA